MYSGNPSAKKKFKPFKNINRSHQPRQLTLSSPPIQGLNVEEGRINNDFCTHKENHSETTYQVFINLFGSSSKSSTPEASQPTITELEGDVEDEVLEGEVEETDAQPNTMNVTWDVMSKEVHATSNDYNLRSKGPVVEPWG